MLKFPQLTTVDNFTIVKNAGAIKLADRIELNIDYIAFCRCIDLGVTKYNLVGGMMDAYQDQTGVNTSACIGQTYDSTNKLYSPTTGGFDTYSKLILQNNVSASQTKAIYFDGSGDYLSVADSADWDFGTGDFTIEMFVNLSNGNVVFMEAGVFDGTGYGLNYSVTGYLNFWVNNTNPLGNPTWTPVYNRFYHLAVSRSGTSLKMFVDGVVFASATSSISLSGGTQGVKLGMMGSSYFKGFIKEFRMSNSARYTAAFTPTATLFTADSNTKLLIHAEEAIGATTFIDSETTPKTVTTNGDCKINLTTPLMEGVFLDTEITSKTITTVGGAKQIPYMFNNTAGFFNGTASYLVVADSADWDFGTGNFTYEFWTMLTGTTLNYQTWISRNYDNDVAIRTSSSGDFQFNIGNSVTAGGTYPFKFFQWYHVACVRNGTGSNQCMVFINGILTYQGTSSYSVSSSTPIYIGAELNAGHAMTGYMKEVRISNSARYTTTFTPSTTQFTTDANTKLLMHFDTPATAPLGPAIAFPVAGYGLTTPDHADFHPGTGQWCVDGWIYMTAASGTYVLMDGTAAGSGNGVMCYISPNYNVVGVYLNTTGVGDKSYTPTLSKWTHVAFQRDATGVSMWVDGIQIGTRTANSTNVAASGNIRIFSGSGGTYVNCTGFLRNLRYSNTARYTDGVNFTPSQQVIAVDANTKLLIRGDENNGVTTFVDQSGKTIATEGTNQIKYIEDYRNTIFLDSETTPKYPYPVGLAKIDFVAPFGTGVGYFAATSYLNLDGSADFTYGTGDFTIDMWVKPNALSTQTLYDGRNGGDGAYPLIYLNSSGYVIYYVSSAARITGTIVLTAKTWWHILVARSGTSTKLFVNGIQDGSTYSDSTTYLACGAGRPRIAEHYAAPGTSTPYAGFIDNFRVSKGIARWTATFNPPSEDFYTNANMTLQSIAFSTSLTPNDNRIILYEEDVDTIALNTDLKAYASRDNGTTWNQITLTNAGYYSGTRRILSGVADISMQPVQSSYNMLYKVTTLNNKALKLRGAGMNWG